MKFGISKFAEVIVHRGTFEPAEGILTSIGKITYVETDMGYKYLKVVQTNEYMQNKINDEAKQIYIKKIKHVLMSSLNGRNKNHAINRNAIPMITYSTGITIWTQTK